MRLTGEAGTRRRDSRGKLRRPRDKIVSMLSKSSLTGQGLSNRERSKKTYTEDTDTAHNRCVLGRGEGLVGRGEDTLGSAGATAGRLNVDLFGGHFRLGGRRV